MSSPRLRARRPSFATMAVLLLTAVLQGCSQMPTSGPSEEQVLGQRNAGPASLVQVIDIDERVIRQLGAQQRQRLFSELFPGPTAHTGLIGRGDTVEVTVWEAPPATLFSAGAADARGPQTTRANALPEQVVDQQGYIQVPFAGRLQAAGVSAQALQAEIVNRLRGKANSPEVLVRVMRNASALVTVVGEVGTSVRMPLTPSGERLLDALAAAGGVRQAVNKVTLQLTRGDAFATLPLDLVIRDPRQNIPLAPGDVITALYQPFTFTALGATGKNEEIAFEAQGISLAQALARAGGLIDSRSNPQGVFLFRFERQNALEWPRQPAAATAEGLVPVVYRLDLRNPVSFFAMQSFRLSPNDVLYVSNAPAAELQKFLNLLFSVFYPVLTTISVTQ